MAKLCTKCLQTLPLELFGQLANNKKRNHCNGCRAAAQKAYAQKNKENVLARKKLYRLLNKEKCADAIKQWTLRNKEKVRQYKAKYRETNKEKLYAAKKKKRTANPEKARQLEKQWRQNNKARDAYLKAKHYTFKKQAQPKWLTDKHFQEIYDIYKLASKLGMQVDHIIPLQGKNVCGLHTPWNLRPLKKFDNISKKNKLPPKEDWVAWTPVK